MQVNANDAGVSAMDNMIPTSEFTRFDRTKRFWKRMFKRKLVLVSFSFLVVVILVAILAPWIAPYSPNLNDLAINLQPPSIHHLLGTDELGRDVFSRLIFGARVSLAVGFVSVAIAGSIGMLLGLVAGYFGGWVDAIIMRGTDMMMAIPLMILALFIGSAIGQGLFNVMLSIGIGLVPAYARLTRGQVKSIKELDYVAAAVVSGSRKSKIALLHILPNSLSSNIVLMTMNLGLAILIEAALSFLGLGINPPTPSWGSMVSEGYDYLNTLPVLSIAPGVAIVLVVLAFNIVGDALRDTLDPRLKGTL